MPFPHARVVPQNLAIAAGSNRGRLAKSAGKVKIPNPARNGAIVKSMADLFRCYRVLGLQPGATLEDVNRAYRQLALLWHPDRVAQRDPELVESAREKFAEIAHACEQLRQFQAKAEARQAERTRRSQASPSPSPTRSTPHATPWESSRDDRASRHPERHADPHRDRATAASRHADRERHAYPDRQAWQHHVPPRDSAHCMTDDRLKHAAAEPKSTRSPHPDLTGADLRGANLKEKDLSCRNLSHANLTNADLSDGFLHRTNLSGAILCQANLFRANLLEADLRHADLRGANLIGADLSGADLSGADLSTARIGFGNKILVKLTGVKLEGAILPEVLAGKLFPRR